MSFMFFNVGRTIEVQRREGVLYSIISNGTERDNVLEGVAMQCCNIARASGQLMEDQSLGRQ